MKIVKFFRGLFQTKTDKPEGKPNISNQTNASNLRENIQKTSQVSRIFNTSLNKATKSKPIRNFFSKIAMKLKNFNIKNLFSTNKKSNIKTLDEHVPQQNLSNYQFTTATGTSKTAQATTGQACMSKLEEGEKKKPDLAKKFNENEYVESKDVTKAIIQNVQVNINQMEYDSPSPKSTTLQNEEKKEEKKLEHKTTDSKSDGDISIQNKKLPKTGSKSEGDDILSNAEEIKNAQESFKHIDANVYRQENVSQVDKKQSEHNSIDDLDQNEQQQIEEDYNSVNDISNDSIEEDYSQESSSFESSSMTVSDNNDGGTYINASCIHEAEIDTQDENVTTNEPSINSIHTEATSNKPNIHQTSDIASTQYTNKQQQKLANYAGVTQTLSRDPDDLKEIISVIQDKNVADEGGMGAIKIHQGEVIKSGITEEGNETTQYEHDVSQNIRENVQTNIKESKLVSSFEGNANINTITDIVEVDGSNYTFQKQIKGDNLLKHMEKMYKTLEKDEDGFITKCDSFNYDKFDQHEAIKYAAQSIASLFALAEAGMVNLDIKPDNTIMKKNLDGTLTPVDIDFGLAEKLGESIGYHGTWSYASPEMNNLWGSEDEIKATPQQDVYSYGFKLLSFLFPDAFFEFVDNEKWNEKLKNEIKSHDDLRIEVHNKLAEVNSKRPENKQYPEILMKLFSNTIADCWMKEPEDAYEFKEVTKKVPLQDLNNNPITALGISERDGQKYLKCYIGESKEDIQELLLTETSDEELTESSINPEYKYQVTLGEGIYTTVKQIKYDEKTKQVFEWIDETEFEATRNDVKYDPNDPKIRPEPIVLKRIFDGIWASPYMATKFTSAEFVPFTVQAPDESAENKLIDEKITVKDVPTTRIITQKDENGNEQQIEIAEIKYELYGKEITVEISMPKKDADGKEIYDINRVYTVSKNELGEEVTIELGNRIEDCDILRINPDDKSIELQVSKYEYIQDEKLDLSDPNSFYMQLNGEDDSVIKGYFATIQQEEFDKDSATYLLALEEKSKQLKSNRHIHYAELSSAKEFVVYLQNTLNKMPLSIQKSESFQKLSTMMSNVLNLIKNRENIQQN